MDDAAHILLHLGRPGDIRLGAALTGTPTPLATGLDPLDEMLGGGLPRGRITELAGPRSTGRTSLACAIAAGATRVGAVVAWIDPDDTLDPETAAETGLALRNVLWIRPREAHDAFRATDLVLTAGGFAIVVLDLTRPELGHRFSRWTRLARAAERSGTALLVLSSVRHTGALATLGLEVTARQAHWSAGAGRLPLLDGVTAHLTVARTRFGHPGSELVVRHACA